MKTMGNSTYRIYDPLGLKLLTRLRLDFITTLITDLKNVNDFNLPFNESDLLHVILHGNKNFHNNMNIRILTVTIKFIKDSETFLFLHSYHF